MEYTREGLRDQVVVLLSASRELSPAEDEALAESFVDRLGNLPDRKPRAAPLLYPSISTLAVLLAIPAVMVIQTYSKLDGYLPPLDAGALPIIYWFALIAAVLCTIVALARQQTGTRVRMKAVGRLPR